MRDTSLRAGWISALLQFPIGIDFGTFKRLDEKNELIRQIRTKPQIGFTTAEKISADQSIVKT